MKDINNRSENQNDDLMDYFTFRWQSTWSLICSILSYRRTTSCGGELLIRTVLIAFDLISEDSLNMFLFCFHYRHHHRRR